MTSPAGRFPGKLDDLGGGLFECMSDRRTCIRAAFLPCCVFAENSSHKAVDEGRSAECCCAYLLCNVDMCCILAGWMRGRIQRRLGVQETSPCTNACTHCCCYLCAVSQEARALRRWDELHDDNDAATERLQEEGDEHGAAARGRRLSANESIASAEEVPPPAHELRAASGPGGGS